MNKPIIPIFYACDDAYVKFTIVSLHSIMKNASKDYDYKVYVLNTNIGKEMQKKLSELQNQNDNLEIIFSNVSSYLDSIEERLPLRHYYSKAIYFRIFIAEMYPEYDKVIYMDSDTIIQGDIADLYNTDIGDCYVAACHEQAMEQVDVYGTYSEKVLGLDRHLYFNDGMMIMNTKLFREKNVLDQFLNYLSEYYFIVTQDQDYLNIICKDHVYWLDQRWNTELTDGLVYPYDYREAYILHYIMVNKPWHYHECRGADIFWSYAKETAIYDVLISDLQAYTDEQRKRDADSADQLYQMAIDEANREDNFHNMQLKKNARPIE